MSTDETWFSDWGCGHYGIKTTTPAELLAKHPGACWLETGCPHPYTKHPAAPCPDVPVVRIEELVDDPRNFKERSKLVVRGRLAIGHGGSVALGREETCGHGAFLWVQLEAKLDGTCYAVRLSQIGLGCPSDESMACCGDLPMGEEVTFVGEYYNHGGEGPFHVELVHAALCTMPGEVIRRPKR